MNSLILVCTIWVNSTMVLIGNERDASAEYARLTQGPNVGEITMSCQEVKYGHIQR